MYTYKKIAIVQSCYIPWKGYFDLINMVDEFILYDDMQYTRRDWRNRNMIKTPNGLQWLTIPVDVKGQYYQKINETIISDNSWAKNHWKSITHNYTKTLYFKKYKDFFEKLYTESENDTHISQVNFKFLSGIVELLNIKTKISWSTDYKIEDSLTKTDRLIALCQQSQATSYLSGPSAKQYMEENKFKDKNIKLEYIDYSNYIKYPQLFGEFEHTVSIIDLIFNTGQDAPNFMNSFEYKKTQHHIQDTDAHDLLLELT